MRSALQFLVIVIALGGTACGARAQGYPFSQRGSVTQHVAHTTIAIEYGRPVARGRALSGRLVPWDSVWHPGADSATRISFDHPVQLEGREVKAGEYSVWLVPHEGPRRERVRDLVEVVRAIVWGTCSRPHIDRGIAR